MAELDQVDLSDVIEAGDVEEVPKAEEQESKKQQVILPFATEFMKLHKEVAEKRNAAAAKAKPAKRARAGSSSNWAGATRKPLPPLASSLLSVDDAKYWLPEDCKVSKDDPNGRWLVVDKCPPLHASGVLNDLRIRLGPSFTHLSDHNFMTPRLASFASNRLGLVVGFATDLYDYRSPPTWSVSPTCQSHRCVWWKRVQHNPRRYMLRSLGTGGKLGHNSAQSELLCKRGLARTMVCLLTATPCLCLRTSRKGAPPTCKGCRLCLGRERVARAIALARGGRGNAPCCCM